MLTMSIKFPPDATKREMQMISFMVNTHYTTICLAHGVLPDATDQARRRALEELRSVVQTAFPDVSVDIVDIARPGA